MARRKLSRSVAQEFLAGDNVQNLRRAFEAIDWDRRPTEREWEDLRGDVLCCLREIPSKAVTRVQRKLEALEEHLTNLKDRVESELDDAIGSIQERLEMPWE